MPDRVPTGFKACQELGIEPDYREWDGGGMKASKRELMQRMSLELIIAELATWAAFHGDPLPREDRDRTLLAIRRMAAIKEAINARLS